MKVTGDDQPPNADDLVRVFDGEDELRVQTEHLAAQGWTLISSTAHPRRRTLRRRLRGLFKEGGAMPPPRVVATFRRQSTDDHHP